MSLSEIQKLEKAVVIVLNIDGWNLKWSEGKYEHYDASGYTSKGHKCVIEFKFRNKYYEEKLLEVSKYNNLMSLPEDVIKLYFVNDPKGNYMFWLNTLEMPEPVKLYCPETTLWKNKKRKKSVYLLKENLASRINLNY